MLSLPTHEYCLAVYLSCWGSFLLFLVFWQFLLWKGVGFLSNAFSVNISIEVIICFPIHSSNVEYYYRLLFLCWKDISSNSWDFSLFWFTLFILMEHILQWLSEERCMGGKSLKPWMFENVPLSYLIDSLTGHRIFLWSCEDTPLFPLASRIETPQPSLPAQCLDPIFQCGGRGLSTGFAPVLLSYIPAKSIFPSLRFDLGTIPSIAAPATVGCPDTAIKTRELYRHHISPASVWRMGCALTAAWLNSQIQKSQTTDMRESLCFMSSRENKVEIAIKKIKRKKKQSQM